MYEYQGGATTSCYAGVGGNNALRRAGHTANNGVFYLLGDHLGSTSVLVNQNGTLNSTNYYYPYGSNRGGAQSTLTAKRYTGQYHEEGLAGSQGLYYYGARWYDPQLARFAQADTIVPDPTLSMSLNRYMYV
ncbi:MAG: RHS repeat-associated core domain-containing protein, partial [Halieaceae bacterium]|nr:RHS repeat-associated core domain-containing protein [Halieaceae bacterium]